MFFLIVFWMVFSKIIIKWLLTENYFIPAFLLSTLQRLSLLYLRISVRVKGDLAWGHIIRSGDLTMNSCLTLESVLSPRKIAGCLFVCVSVEFFFFSQHHSLSLSQLLCLQLSSSYSSCSLAVSNLQKRQIL